MTAAPATGVGDPIRARRVIVGLLLAIVGIGSVFWLPAFVVLCTAIALGCLWEFAQLSARKGPWLEMPVAMVAIVLYFVLTYLGEIHRYEGVLLAATVVVALVTGLFASSEGAFARSGYTLLGRALHRQADDVLRRDPAACRGSASAATVMAILLIALTDIFAMLIGTRFGRTPLSPISPRKTVEGSAGGLGVAIVAGIAIGLTPWLHLPVVAGRADRRDHVGRRASRRPGRERAQARRAGEGCRQLDRRTRRRPRPLRFLHLRRDRVLLRTLRRRRDPARDVRLVAQKNHA